MENYKITDSELNSGVVAAPDTLTDTPRNNKLVFDRLPRLIAGKFNGFVDSVIAKFANYYTKVEVDDAITDIMVEAGAGDMLKGIYDKNQNGIVDNAEAVRGFWIAYGDENGNNTEELYLHYME